MEAFELAGARFDEAVSWRRLLHSRPELSWEETETAAFIVERLGELDGVEVSRPTPTSVVGRLRGSRPGRVLALRADIDALPITEEADVPYASQRPGVMHACGHDAHTAQLLAAASILSDLRGRLSGEVRFIFQHAEEVPPGGARELVAAGVMDGVDVVVGCHLVATLDFGKIAVPAVPHMASADTFEIEIEGRGGHGGLPHETIDPILVAAHVVSNLQAVVSRQADPLDPVVVSVTRIAGGNTDNIIPQTVTLGGSIRTFHPSTRTAVRPAIERIIDGITRAHGASYKCLFTDGYAPVANDPTLAVGVATAVATALGDDALGEVAPIMAGDDFSAYQAKAPGVYFMVGAHDPNADANFPHHHPRVTIDERAMQLATATFVQVALDAD